MIPRFRPPLKWKQIFKILGGAEVPLEDWEKRLAAAAGYAHAVWFPYGRVAVKAYFESQSGNAHAVLSPFNCSALLAGLLSARVNISYVDTEPTGFNQDPDLFLSALRVSKKRTGIIVHQWGIDPHLPVNATPNPLLHDKALCDLVSPVEHLKNDDAVLHSFGWGKPIASLHGAALFTNFAPAAARWKTWQQTNLLPALPIRDFAECVALKLAFQPMLFGVTQQIAGSLPPARQLSGNTAGGGTSLPGNWNRLVSESIFQMAWEQIETQIKNSAKRIEINDHYSTLLQPLTGVLALPPTGIPLSHYPVRLQNRDGLHKHLLRSGIFSSNRLFNRLLSDLAPNQNSKRDFPNARRLCAETLHLPLYPSLGIAEQRTIAAAISEWCRQQEREKSCYSITTDVSSSTIRS